MFDDYLIGWFLIGILKLIVKHIFHLALRRGSWIDLVFLTNRLGELIVIDFIKLGIVEC